MPTPAPRSREQPLAFASFRLLRAQKVLLENDLPVRIGSRALDLLIALVERAGEVVGKNELMACVWPETIVEENNLRVHISALRKLFGDGDQGRRFIINVAGRGYSFVAPVARVDEQPSKAGTQVPSVALPVSLTRVVGREDVISDVIALLGTCRLVTLYGPGGIGKTTVGLAIADHLARREDVRICFVDLAVVADPGLLVPTIAAAVGGPTPMDDPLSALSTYLQPVRLVLILDNCEHLVDAVAATVERLLHSAPALKILATSRERLQAQGEHAVPLRPLSFPDATASVTFSDALSYPAVELFIERAQGAHGSFAVTDQNIPTIAAICRGLDGIPLAIELVAARTNVLGLEELLRSLEQDLLAVSGHRRSAGRHQSLTAALEWSFRLLSNVEQTILLRISTFCDRFSMRAAAAVVAGGTVTPEHVADGLMSLTQRSLVVADADGVQVRYRLLYVTRAFALARLAAIDEGPLIHRRHAEYCCHVLEAVLEEWSTLSRKAWHQSLDAGMADLRAALAWAFGPGGDASLGARLFVASLPAGVALSQQEFEIRALRTLQVLHNQPVMDRIAELRVRTGIATMLVHTGQKEERWRLELERLAELALQVGVPRLMTDPLTACSVMALEAAEYQFALQRFEQLESVAKQADDPFAVLVADRLGAQVFHWAGDQKRARARAERVLRHPSLTIPLAYGPGNVDRQVSMRIVLARVAWLEGRADEASAIVADALERADMPLDLCQALGFAACPLALWRGDLREAQALTATLLETARRHGFVRWHRWALCFGQCADGSVTRGPGTPFSPLQQDLLATVDGRWAAAESLGRAESGAGGWCNAELLRLAGERHHLRGSSDSRSMADLRYRTALEQARREGTLAWELRIATSLARLRIDEGQRAAAREALESACSKFTEGLDTADYRAALTVMAGL